MRRAGDLGAILAIGFGLGLAGPLYGSLDDVRDGDVDIVIQRRFDRADRFERRYQRRDRFERRFEGGRSHGGRAGGCAVPFQKDSRGPGWSVGGEYTGMARLTPDGLEIEVARGTLEADRPADVRGVVFGVAQWTGESSWIVTHRAAPIPLGDLEPRQPRSIANHHLIVPGIGPTELVEGWLVVEHVLNDPAAGGTAWTYAHARSNALAPLAFGCPRS
jgi:hypothetical protein